ncbi:MAG: hypothetical protein M3Q79_01455 [bacterium]|nr:hypothetical protein [bacterium]
MVKRKSNKRPASKVSAKESDSEYFLKLTMYMIIGSQWIRIERFPEWQIPIPYGLLIGLWFASRDHFQIDRKIEYAILLTATMVGFWLPIGIRFSL